MIEGERFYAIRKRIQDGQVHEADSDSDRRCRQVDLGQFVAGGNPYLRNPFRDVEGLQLIAKSHLQVSGTDRHHDVGDGGIVADVIAAGRVAVPPASKAGVEELPTRKPDGDKRHQQEQGANAEAKTTEDADMSRFMAIPAIPEFPSEVSARTNASYVVPSVG